MKGYFRSITVGISLAAAFILSASQVRAIIVDGTLDGGYGGALAVQTINTGFGDSTIGDGTSAGGSELDAAYGVISGGNLYLFLSGNFESNGNHVNVFIDGGGAGQNTLAAPATGTMQTMNGSKFSSGFNATFAVDVNNFSGTIYTEEYDLIAVTGGYVGAIPLAGGIGNGTPTGGGPPVGFYGMNDTNAAGVNGAGGTAASSAAALAVGTGYEIQLPLASIGYTGGSIKVLADINGGGDSFLSNQFLPGLTVGSGNVGNGGVFDLSGTPGQYFVVVPEPSTVGLVITGLLGLLAVRRRKV
jgi:hypothetical protein